MRSTKVFLCLLMVLGVCGQAQQSSSQVSKQSQPMPTEKRIVIAAGTVLDGRGHVLHNTRIVIEGSKIVAIDSKAGSVDYDLRGLVVLPGWICPSLSGSGRLPR